MTDDVIPGKVPKHCCACGQRVYSSKHSFQHHWENGEEYVWHVNCLPPWKREGWPNDRQAKTA
jgi:hypothetical protein